MRSTARNDEVVRTSGSRTWLSLLLLLAVSPVAAQQDADGHIQETIGPGVTSEKAFSLRNAVNCPDDSYRFLLTSDREFVRLPVDTIELSKAENTRVRVLFDSNRLDPGVHTANITVKCRDCGRCRASDKTLRVVLTVVADDVGIEDNTVEADDVGIEDNTVEAGDRVTLTSGVRVPDLADLTVAEAQSRLDDVGLLLVTSFDDAATVSQIPAAGALVAVGTSVSLVLPVVGSTSISNAWLAIIVLLVIATIFFFFWRASARTPAAPAASIEVRPIMDTGTQRVWSEGNEPQRPVIRVRLTGDAAEQSVQGNPATITERDGNGNE
jgi:hypothetical protein